VQTKSSRARRNSFGGDLRQMLEMVEMKGACTKVTPS
jgi:hypothetical protein